MGRPAGEETFRRYEKTDCHIKSLAGRLEILFMDEPFKGLDIETKKKVMEYVKNECLGKTVVFVTHDPEEAKEMGAEILVL